MQDFYNKFLNSERHTLEGLNKVIETENLSNIIIYRPLQLKNDLIVNVPYLIEAENNLITYDKIKLVPYFKKYWVEDFFLDYNNPHYTIKYIYPTELLKEISARETTILSGNRITLDNLSYLGFNNYSETYERYGIIGLVLFFQHKKTGDIYQFLPEIEANLVRQKPIFERPNKWFLKVRTDKEVNKIISEFNNRSIKYDLSGDYGYRSFVYDIKEIENIWSLSEMKQLIRNYRL